MKDSSSVAQACDYPAYKQTNPDVRGLKEEDAYLAEQDSFYSRKNCLQKGYVKLIRDYDVYVRIIKHHSLY